MPKQYVRTPKRDSRSHSLAVIVENPRKTIYLAGVSNRDENSQPVTESFELAARTAFARLKEGVERAGGTLADIVTMTVFIIDVRLGDEFVKIRREYFPEGAYPASALITVAGFTTPGICVEIQAVAVVD